MTEMSQWKKTVFRRGCESDTVERVQRIMPQAGSEWHRLAASVENTPAKLDSLSALWSWTSRFKSRTCMVNPCLWAEGWGCSGHKSFRRVKSSAVDIKWNRICHKTIQNIKAGGESGQCPLYRRQFESETRPLQNQNRMLQKYDSVKWVNNGYALRLVETFNSCNFFMETNFWLQ